MGLKILFDSVLEHVGHYKAKHFSVGQKTNMVSKIKYQAFSGYDYEGPPYC